MSFKSLLANLFGKGKKEPPRRLVPRQHYLNTTHTGIVYVDTTYLANTSNNVAYSPDVTLPEVTKERTRKARAVTKTPPKTKGTRNKKKTTKK